MKIVEISDNYINYMKTFFKQNMLDNKEGIEFILENIWVLYKNK